MLRSTLQKRRGFRMGVHAEPALLALGGGVLAVAIALGCAKEIERKPKPKAPNVDATIAAFENPTLNIEDDVVSQLEPYVEDAYQLIEDLELEEAVLDPILDALEESEEMSSAGAPGMETMSLRPASLRTRTQSVVLEGDGFLRVTRICAGWEEPVVDEEKNGKIVAIAGFTEVGLDPVLWADFFGCKYLTGAGEILLEAGSPETEAAVILAFEDAVPMDQVEGEPIVFVVDLSATIEDTTQRVQLAFRHTPGESRYEFLFTTPEGTAVLLSEKGSLVGIRAKNGTYSCDSVEATCVDADGNTLML